MAVSSPLLEASIEGARGVLLSISGGVRPRPLRDQRGSPTGPAGGPPGRNIIFGAVIDDALGDEVRVTVIAAGFDGGEPKPRTKPFRGVEDLPAPAQALTPAVDNAAGVDSASQVPVPAVERAPESVQLPNEPARVRRPIVFDDTSATEDDLDVPDFLK